MEITVKLRLSTKHESKIAAHADVAIALPSGTIQLNSFCIFKLAGKAAWVASPATKGEKRYFRLVVLTGEIRKEVEAAILKEYERQTGGPA